MESVNIDFSESETHLKETLRLPDHAVSRLEHNVHEKLTRHRRQNKRRPYVITATFATCCLLLALFVPAMVQELRAHSLQGASIHGAFPTVQESEHWQIQLLPTQDTYLVEIKPTTLQPMRNVIVQLVDSFTVSGSDLYDGQSKLITNFNIPDQTTKLVWVLTWTDSNGRVQNENLTFTRQ